MFSKSVFAHRGQSACPMSQFTHALHRRMWGGSVGFSLGCEIGLGLVYRSTLIGVGASADKRTCRRFPRGRSLTVMRRALLLPLTLPSSRESRRAYFWGRLTGFAARDTHGKKMEKRKKKKKRSDAPIRDAKASSHRHSARRATDRGPSCFTPFVADGTRDCPVTRNLHS